MFYFCFFFLSDSNPIKIKRPIELAGKTLEWRLQNYDWENHFEYFQEATKAGSFNPMCWKRGQSIIPVSFFLILSLKIIKFSVFFVNL